MLNTSSNNRLSQHGRTIEKVLVTYLDKDGTRKDYLMNKNLSTPYDCAKHVNMLLARRSALAIISYSDQDVRLECMNEAFRDKCQLELVDFQTEQHAQTVNQAYWRSCSVVLAAALTKGLRDNITIAKFHSKVPDSYFAVDINGLQSELSQDDLKDLTLFLRSDFINKAVPFETVTLPSELAAEYGFDSSVRLCRFGDFVTAVDGPVISRSDQIGRFNIVKALTKDNFTRVGGVSLPSTLKCSSYSWGMVVENAMDKIT
ncbi:unnamed protein product [Heligmosomoides polygyrus]|uniref:TGS domain-containing protein n=1 Tax=Heligmosomoides polygyrus TaxID=6339 RepID=A0A3P8A8X5_HELPZ|nr:unnamed protein product [Heligmosomoides polygyrus]